MSLMALLHLWRSWHCLQTPLSGSCTMQHWVTWLDYEAVQLRDLAEHDDSTQSQRSMWSWQRVHKFDYEPQHNVYVGPRNVRMRLLVLRLAHWPPGRSAGRARRPGPCRPRPQRWHRHK